MRVLDAGGIGKAASVLHNGIHAPVIRHLQAENHGVIVLFHSIIEDEIDLMPFVPIERQVLKRNSALIEKRIVTAAVGTRFAIGEGVLVVGLDGISIGIPLGNGELKPATPRIVEVFINVLLDGADLGVRCIQEAVNILVIAGELERPHIAYAVSDTEFVDDGLLISEVRVAKEPSGAASLRRGLIEVVVSGELI